MYMFEVVQGYDEGVCRRGVVSELMTKEIYRHSDNWQVFWRLQFGARGGVTGSVGNGNNGSAGAERGRMHRGGQFGCLLCKRKGDGKTRFRHCRLRWGNLGPFSLLP